MPGVPFESFEIVDHMAASKRGQNMGNSWTSVDPFERLCNIRTLIDGAMERHVKICTVKQTFERVYVGDTMLIKNPGNNVLDAELMES